MEQINTGEQKMTSKYYIQKALGWSDYKYGKVVMDSAIEWIKFHFKSEPIMLDVLTRSTVFWQWWKNQWEHRDKRFIEVTAIDLLDYPIAENIKEILNEDYAELHDIGRLIIKPNRMVTKDCMRIIKMEIKKEQLILKQYENSSSTNEFNS